MKTALVTGGAKRIGKVICEHLSKAGYTVIIHANHSLKEANALAATLLQASVVHGDLSNSANAKQIIDDAAKPFGAISLLVNNASLFEKDEFDTLNPQLLEKHFAVNFTSPLFLSQAFAKQAPNGASIINIIDQRVLKPTPEFFSYALSKEALWAATKMMAQALAPHLRVNAIAPGPTLKNERQAENDFKAQYQNILLEHPSFAEDIAKATLFLAENSSVTGQLLCVDSGQHLGWKTPDVWGVKE